MAARIKVIFLDCDGVLSPLCGDKFFLPEKMKLLKRIVDATGAEIVLSSSWRVSEFGRNEVSKNLALHEIPGFIDCTPELQGSRANEILQWIAKAQRSGEYQIVNFVALDDIDLARGAPNPAFFAKHAVCTASNIGLTNDEATRAIALLSDSNNIE